MWQCIAYPPDCGVDIVEDKHEQGYTRHHEHIHEEPREGGREGGKGGREGGREGREGGKRTVSKIVINQLVDFTHTFERQNLPRVR